MRYDLRDPEKNVLTWRKQKLPCQNKADLKKSKYEDGLKNLAEIPFVFGADCEEFWPWEYFFDRQKGGLTCRNLHKFRKFASFAATHRRAAYGSLDTHTSSYPFCLRRGHNPTKV